MRTEERVEDKDQFYGILDQATEFARQFYLG